MRSSDLYHKPEKWTGHTHFTEYIVETQATLRSTAERNTVHRTGPGINLTRTPVWEAGAFQTFSKP